MRLMFGILFCLGIWNTLGPAIGEPSLRSYTLSVDGDFGSAHLKYTTHVQVLAFGKTYSSSINYLGRLAGVGIGAPGNINSEMTTPGLYPAGLVSLIQAHPYGAVINGGFSSTDPATPAGLLIISGRVFSPLSVHLSAILCVHSSGKLTFIPTAATVQNTFNVLNPCESALQSGPVILQKGANVIGSTEPVRKKEPFRRTIIGFDAAGALYAVLFTSPVHLYVAGEFLRAPPRSGNSLVIKTSGGRITSTGSGLGLTEAVNLDGDQNSIGVLNGKVITGDIYRRIPSALVLQ